MTESYPPAVVTGASRGIGLATAKGLARRGYQTILVCRDRPAGERALAQVAGAGPATPVLLVNDLALQRNVRELAREIRARWSRLPLLIHNAAVVVPERTLTPDGIELQFAVNHLAVFLLTRELLPLIRASAPARILVTASQVERSGEIDFDDLDWKKSYDPARAYARTKLANVLFTHELADRLAGTGITVNCLHPGVVRTRLLETLLSLTSDPGPSRFGALRRSAGGVLRRLGVLPPVRDWALDPQTAAEATLHLATSQELAHVTGQFFRDLRPAAPSPTSRDPILRSRLWEASARLTATDPDWMGQADP